ncbi:MAG: hypothetical protein FD157_4042 [Rhodocyclaceae bacterium]|nr:MAG: hypothetical protein FD157_4042 [Rhodocyclaceae bacterium]TNC98524.1 MAG: hypothetical protein FD118_4028 [Rhodocyclaceae bacterium]
MPNADIVVTSINPGGKIAYQITCYRKWKSLGYQVVTFNTEEEATKLRYFGVDVLDIRIINENSSARNIHGINSPRIKPIFDALVRDLSLGSLIITNSDIFPRVSKKIELLQSIASCAGFTRREIVGLDLVDPATIKQYRGGIDLFHFGQSALRKLSVLLERDDLADRMAFGVPGWDFYLGGLILSDAMQGIVLDGSMFCHLSHKTTYRHVGEFSHYVEKLRTMGFVNSRSHEQAAAEFVSRIELECKRNHKLSVTLNSIYDETFRRSTIVEEPLACQINTGPLLEANIFYKSTDAPKLIQNVLAEGVDLVRFKTYFCKSPSIEVQFGQYLACLYFLLYIAIQTKAIKLTSKYPLGNAHKAAIANATRLGNRLEARYYLLDILSSEIIEYGIFNKNLFKGIALSCINSSERLLFTRIANLISGLVSDQPS